MTERCPCFWRAREYPKFLGVNLIEYDVEKDRSKAKGRLINPAASPAHAQMEKIGSG